VSPAAVVMFAPPGRIRVDELWVRVSAPANFTHALRPALSVAKSMSVIVVVPVMLKYPPSPSETVPALAMSLPCSHSAATLSGVDTLAVSVPVICSVVDAVEPDRTLVKLCSSTNQDVPTDASVPPALSALAIYTSPTSTDLPDAPPIFPATVT
jgi:hypothetical protein